MGGSAPKPPPVVKPPSKTDEEVQSLAVAEKARSRAAKGRKSTILTEMYGLKDTFGG